MLLAATSLGAALLRFGATSGWALSALLLALCGTALVACWTLSLDGAPRRRLVLLAAGAALLLAQVALRPPHEGQGYALVAAGWLALLVTLWAAAGRDAIRGGVCLLLVGVGVFEAAFGLLEVHGVIEPLARHPEIQRHLVIGTLINPNHFAGLVNVALCLAVGLGLASGSHDARRAGGGRATAVTLAAGGSALLMTLALLRTGSRGGAVALVAGLAAVASLAIARRWLRAGGRQLGTRLWLLAVFGSAAVLLAGGQVVLARAGMLSLQNRAEVYRDTVELIADHPWRGVGPGMYRWRFREYQTENLKNLYVHAHNDYLESAAEWGLPAAAAFWAFLGWRLYRSARRAVEEQRAVRAGLALGAAGALTSLLVHSLIDFNLQIPGNLVVVAMLVGAVWSLEPGSGGRGAATCRRTATAVLRIGLPLLLAAAGGRTVTHLTGLYLAGATPGEVGLAAAVDRDPENANLHYRLGLERSRDLAPEGRRRAIGSFEQAVRLNPWMWRAWSELGKARELAGDGAGAEAAYLEAASRNPRDWHGRWGLANLYLRQGRVELSIPHFTAAFAEPQAPRDAGLAVLVKAGATWEQIDRSWPQRRAERLVLLRWLAAPAGDRFEPELLVGAWQELLHQSPPLLSPEGDFFPAALLRRDRPGLARQAWIDLQSAGGTIDPAFTERRELIWNRDFDLELSRGAFDWRLPPARSAAVERREGAGDDGTVALLFPCDRGRRRLSQLVWLGTGGRFRIGLALRPREAGDGAALGLQILTRDRGEALLRTVIISRSERWERHSYDFNLPVGEGSLAEVRLELEPQGADLPCRDLWLDSFSLTKIEGASAR